MARKFTVTHPDGTQSTRTSRNADYAYAVVLAETGAARAADLRAQARDAQEEADRYAEALNGPITREPYFRPGQVEVLVGGVFAGVDVDDATALNAVQGYHRTAELDAGYYLARAEAVSTSPTVYSVVRWSRTQALAEKGAREFERLLHHGTTLTVVAVD